jgi:histidine kinase
MSSSIRHTAGELGKDVPSVPEFELTDVLRETGTTVYRARDILGDRPVILKTRPGLADQTLSRSPVEHEYQVTRTLQTEHVIRCYGLTRFDDGLALVLEDFGGESLEALLNRDQLDTGRLLDIAIAVAQGLQEIHQAGIIHKDISPANIVHNLETGVTKIIDFGISTQLTREQADLARQPMLDGSLPYLSPEQTGRINRPLDYRTDFYSFGATFYELFTGKRMFDAEEPLAWLHCHIAHDPVPPSTRNPKVPEQVSRILLKLVSKSADDRYQSAAGLVHDLQRCKKQWDSAHQIENFPLAELDVQDRLRLQQRLYGREPQIQQLMTSFERISQGASELILVSGYSGIGKTSLVKELYRPITAQRGFFISGKFDQLKRNLPYSALAHALQALLRQLLSEPEERLDHWRQRIANQLGNNAPLLTSLLPQLSLILPSLEEDAAPDQKDSDHQRHFRRVLAGFIRLFTDAEHPLVIFIDDLQWADSATLALLETLLDPRRSNYLLVIGAYRDNEVGASHPLLNSLNRIKDQGAAVDTLQLKPLRPKDVQTLVADALRASIEQVEALADLVYAKAAGNPFFTEEFLRHLCEEGLLRFDANSRIWRYDINQIQSAQITDNVVDLMQAKLRQLAPATRQLLETGACIGNRFRLGTLILVADQAPRAVAIGLQQALNEGLIAPLGDAYELSQVEHRDPAALNLPLAFAHDRIQQAAYQLLSEENRAKAHLRIGRLLHESRGENSPGDDVFATADHLNRASTLITDTAERRLLCTINIEAGRRARASAAYQSAYEYFQAALATSEVLNWQADYHLLLQLYAAVGDAAYLTGDFASADALIRKALDKTNALEDATELYRVLIGSLVAQSRHEEAVAIGKPLMRNFDNRYPKHIRPYHLLIGYWRARVRLRLYGIERLKSLPDTDDQSTNAAFRIGERLATAATLADPMLMTLMVMIGVEGTMRDGITDRTAATFAGFATVMCRFGHHLEAPKMIEVGEALAKRHPTTGIAARVEYLDATFVRPWFDPLNDVLPKLQSSYERLVEDGDFESAALAATYHADYSLRSGMPLPAATNLLNSWHEAMLDISQHEARELVDILLQYCQCLAGNADDPTKLNGDAYDIDKRLTDHLTVGPGAWRLALYASSLQCHLLLLLRKTDEALVWCDVMRPNLNALKGVFDAAWQLVTDALVRLEVCGRRSGKAREKLIGQVERSLKELKRWQTSNPAQFTAPCSLIEAELHRVHDRIDEAQRAYDCSIEAAQEQRAYGEAALAYELAGRMNLEAGRKVIAEAYLRKALLAYQRWGAPAKVEQLEQEFSWLKKESGSQTLGSSISSTTTRTSEQLLVQVDLQALMTALKAIAQEQVHSRMISQIIETAMAFAGAHKGMLALRADDGRFCIEAEASLEGEPRILQSLPVLRGSDVPSTILNYVARTRAAMVIDDAQQEQTLLPALLADPYVKAHQVRSMLCIPILAGSWEDSELLGMLYLENNRTSHGFTEKHFEMLEIIAIAAAGRLELSKKAAIDSLTGLFNRGYLQSVLHIEVATANRAERPLSLLLIDIDHFKQFNDTWGHQVGDEVLRHVADTIRQCCRDADIVARYGGEEIAVLLPDTTDSSAAVLAERVRAAIESRPLNRQGQPLLVTASIGIAAYQKGQSDDDFVRAADQALYQAKHDGRNCVRLL